MTRSKDPYQQLAEDISKAMKRICDMIVWIAKRTLTQKEFCEFVDEFAEKKENGEQE